VFPQDSNFRVQNRQSNQMVSEVRHSASANGSEERGAWRCRPAAHHVQTMVGDALCHCSFFYYFFMCLFVLLTFPVSPIFPSPKKSKSSPTDHDVGNRLPIVPSFSRWFYHQDQCPLGLPKPIATLCSGVVSSLRSRIRSLSNSTIRSSLSWSTMPLRSKIPLH